jgi:excinuclease UvrABC nuclease subunit
MPFDRIVPRPLTTHGVRTFAPASPGVYGISNAHEWIYIGESDNIQASLLEHLQDSQARVMKKQPTGFVCELCDRAARSSRQDRLILEYESACNRLSTSRYS